MVRIDERGASGSAHPFDAAEGSGWVRAVYQQRASGEDRVSVERVRVHSGRAMAAVEDGAQAGAFFHDDDGEPRAGPGNTHDRRRIDPFLSELVEDELRVVVTAQAADVARPAAQPG